jgi:hypothetical protein
MVRKKKINPREKFFSSEPREVSSNPTISTSIEDRGNTFSLIWRTGEKRNSTKGVRYSSPEPFEEQILAEL